MDGCVTDQFEQAVRATLGIELGSTDRLFNITMQNLIGDDIFLIKKSILMKYQKKLIVRFRLNLTRN